MTDQEAVQLLPREPSDKWEPFEVDRFTRAHRRASCATGSAPTRIVASSVNGAAGPVGRLHDREGPLLAAGRPDARAARSPAARWFVWVGIALLATVLGSVGDRAR